MSFTIHGIGVSGGIAIGHAHLLSHAQLLLHERMVFRKLAEFGCETCFSVSENLMPA